MSPVSTPAAPGSNGPWLVLLLDRDPADPKWLICTVAEPSHVRPALLDAARRHTGEAEAAAWVTSLTGRRVALVPVRDVLAWRIDQVREP